MPAFSDRSPLETAIKNDRMDIWSILVEQIGELSNKEKLQQLRIMVLAGMKEKDVPCKQFKELLKSLPVETVFEICYFVSIVSLNFIILQFQKLFSGDHYLH